MQINDGANAAKITFVIMPLIQKLHTLKQNIHEKADFSKIGNHILPEDLIKASKGIFRKLEEVIISVEKSLKNLNYDGEKNLRDFIDGKIEFS